jgi:hypothetical protein
MTPKAIQTAERALEIAAGERGITPTHNALRFMLAQVLAESAFGVETTTLRGTNNYGAVHSTAAFRHAHAGQADWGEIAHQDHLADGRRYLEWFRIYPSQLEAARDYVGLIAKLTDLAHVSTVDAYVRDLYRGHYFVGFGSDDEERIAGYRSFVNSHLAAIDKGLETAVDEVDDPSEVRIGPFAPLLDRLYVKTDSEAQAVYGKAFEAVRDIDGVRMFACPSMPAPPGSEQPSASAAPGRLRVALALATFVAFAAQHRAGRTRHARP